MSLQDNTSLRRTIGVGSEEYFEFPCESCLTNNKNIEATGYCKDCGHNLCTDCIKVHEKLKSLRNHVIENTPKKLSASNSKIPSKHTDPLLEYCTFHTDEFIKHFCNSHQSLACNDCISYHHRNCQHVSYIRDVASDIANSDELKSLQTDLRRLEATLTSYNTISEKIKVDVIESYSKAVDEIDTLRAEWDKMLDKLHQKFLDSALTLKNEHLRRLEDNSSSCQELINEVSRCLDDLDDKIKSGLNSQLFVSVKQTNEYKTEFMRKADHIGKKCRPRRLVFQRDEQVTNFLTTFKSLGAVLLSREPSDIKAKYERDIYVKSKTDKQDCDIKGSVFLSDGRLCLCDFANQSIKLVDLDTMTFSDQLTLPARPLDATMINDKELAVTIQGDKNLQIVSVSPSLRPSRTILLQNAYGGIAYCEDKLLLTWRTSTNGGVDICDMRGVRIRRIMTDVEGTKLFTNPSRLCVSLDKTFIYVTNYDRNTVVTLDMEGSVINVYKNDDLNTPIGVTVDEEGYVYVCSLVNDTVHQLTRTGHLVKVLLTLKEGVQLPMAIAYRSGKLYVSSFDPSQKNNIKTYSTS